MTETLTTGLVIVVERESGTDAGHDVRLNDAVVGYRPYDGASDSYVAAEVARELALTLRERLGWKTSP